MRKEYLSIAMKIISSLALFSLLFGVTVILVGMAVFSVAPNTNSLFGVLLSFLCAAPLALILFVNPIFVKKVKPYQRYLLPTLIFPLCVGLTLGWNLLQQRPEDMFKMFVADPIPEGVSNIRAFDISGGYDTEIILTFHATPEAIQEIITSNGLVLVEDSFMFGEPHYEYFRDVQWSKDWTIYEKSSNKNKVELITLWINPQGNIVLFRYVYG
jgi:hypothetical protein